MDVNLVIIVAVLATFSSSLLLFFWLRYKLHHNNASYSEIITKLALIDEAQRRISELSANVISLHDIFKDKKARGLVGEVQLKVLLENVLAAQNYSLQVTLSNNCRADCILHLPSPTGNIVIDAKFPLENYQLMINEELSEPERSKAKTAFKTNIKKHIQDIATKYIIAGETSSGAIMFIPAEAIFAEIYANFADLVELAYRQNVWLVSPTTLMAILTTANSVIKDHLTRDHITAIQQHINALGAEFIKFEQRFTDVTRHIELVQKDITQITSCAKKISAKFQQIQQAELGPS